MTAYERFGSIMSPFMLYSNWMEDAEDGQKFPPAVWTARVPTFADLNGDS